MEIYLKTTQPYQAMSFVLCFIKCRQKKQKNKNESVNDCPKNTNNKSIVISF